MEGHVSWGRELTLQGAGKSWVGVLPSSDLGLVWDGGGLEGEKADVEEPGAEVQTETEDGSAAAFSALLQYESQLLKPSSLCSSSLSCRVPGGRRHPMSHLPLLRSVLILSKEKTSDPVEGNAARQANVAAARAAAAAATLVKH